MSTDAIANFPVVIADSFLANDDFAKTLMAKKTGELPEFRTRCRQFLDRLIVVIVGSVSVTSGVSRLLYIFCPESLFEGDDSGVFALFADLCRLLKTCNLATADESHCAVDEFSSYVIEERGQHRSSGQSAVAIDDVMEYLVQDFSFQSRTRLLRIFKLCCLAIKTPDVVYPSVSISLSGRTLWEDALQNCIKLVQSYVLSQDNSNQCFFTGQTMDAVRAAVDQSGVSFVCGEIDLWKDFVGPTYTSFVSSQRDLCNSLLLQRRKEYEIHYIECNKINRLAQVEQSAGTGSGTGSPRQGSKSIGGKSITNDAVSFSGSKKGKSKGGPSVAKKNSGSDAPKNPKQGKNVASADPDVVHKISKPSER